MNFLEQITFLDNLLEKYTSSIKVLRKFKYPNIIKMTRIKIE
jgi:hypothetical protein